MTALSLYVNTFRIALGVNPDDVNSWYHIYGSLSCLRESLLCCVCGKLMVIPMRSNMAHCQHNVCKHCIGGQMRLHPQCVWCLDYRKFEDNVQLRIILQCYKKMCRYILSRGFFRTWNHSEMSSPKLSFISMVSEGAKLEDDYHYTSMESDRIYDSQLTLLSGFDLGNIDAVNGKRTVYSIKLTDNDSSKFMIKKTTFKGNIQAAYVDSDESSDTSGQESVTFIEECLMSLKKRKSCRCGLATRNPGKLTCCGQRCPCYVGGRACFNCRCRGCRNPQKLHVSAPSFHAIHNICQTSFAAPYLSDGSKISGESTDSDFEKGNSCERYSCYK
ncbi:Male-specific lethal 2-like protein, partial [Stegodyphus mimosarum]